MNIDQRAARRLMAVAVVLGIVLRLGFATLYWVNKPLTHDEREYLGLARSITDGRGFSHAPSPESGTTQRFGRAPGYPAFLALVGVGTSDHTSSPPRVKIAQSLLGGFTIWLIGAIALRALGPRAGVIAAAIAAAYPPLVWIPSYVFSESLYSAFALLTAYTLQCAVGSRRNSHPSRRDLAVTLAAGALAGAAILIRPAMLFFLPIAGIWLLTRRKPLLAVALLVASAAVVVPWTVRNARVHGRFILVASEGGVTFWTGNHPLARGEGDLAANPDLKRAELDFRRAHGGLTAEELEPLYYRSAFDWICSNPGQWVLLLGRKAFYTVMPIGPSYTLHSTRYWATSVVSYGVLLPFAMAGFVRVFRSTDPPMPVVLLGASAVLVGLVFFPQERFRIPVIDPLLIIAASAAVAPSRARDMGALA